MLASASTALAEILGGAIALQMLFKIPIVIGSVLMLALTLWLVFSHSYGRLEKLIISFVSIIGLSFLYELTLVDVNWSAALSGLDNN